MNWISVIKKDPEQYKAFQWNGYSRDDYTAFLKEMNWYDGIDAEYFDKGNRLIIFIYSEFDIVRKVEVPERGWIVYDYERDILSNVEFKKKYERVK